MNRPSYFASTKMLRYLIFYCFFGTFFATSMYVINPGPQHPPTKGEVWPKAQQEVKEDLFFEFDPTAYHVKVTSHSCTILTNAIHRYSSALLQLSELARGHRQRQNATRRRRVVCAPDCGAAGDGNYLGALRELRIQLTAPCENYPHFDMDEQYELTVDLISELKSDSIWGILRGLETSSQLFYLTDNGNDVVINKTHITDSPRYPHRGLLLDTSRHYISVSNILLTLDGMAMNKMNVFHWHIVDDQSFPYVSEKFPNLSKYGAYHPTMVYTKADVQNIVNYARDRGIRVVPEFDVPGHTRSWGAAYPSVLTPCYEFNKEIGLGPMNPINDATYKLLWDLFQELQGVFPDQYFHVGGDEVDFACWASNMELLQYMREHNMSSVAELHSLFMERAIPLLGGQSTPIVWQEVFDNGVPLSNDTIVQVWKNHFVQEMKELLAAGKRVLFSSAWYLDHLGDTWEKFYRSDPRTLVGADSRADNIVGGEACMWGEMVDDRNLISRVWPRASAVAERLWSDPDPGFEYIARYGFPVPERAFRRIEEHACRMARRGIAAEPPAGPGYCTLF